MGNSDRVVVLGAGLAGCSCALALADMGLSVDLMDKSPRPMTGASCHNEGKLHLGYIYAADESARTPQLVAEGSLRFFELIERLTGVPARWFDVSAPYVYIVPSDSQIGLDDIVGHFESVDTFVTARRRELTSSAPMSAGVQLLADADRVQHYSADVVAAIQTGEIAVDAHQVASVVAAAVLAHPSISFVPGITVTAAESIANDRYRIVTDADSPRRAHVYEGVVNALWEGRLQVDSTIGLTSPEPWLWRWKAAISIYGAVEPVLPATTALLGPYGDFVEYGRKRSYLSWYPTCLQGLTSERSLDPLSAEVACLDSEQVLREAVRGMATLMPALAAVPDLAQRARVGGGYIMAIGETDIDDPASALHGRHRIGPTARDGWVSLETGKLCTAPWFGVEAARLLVDQLGVRS